jgi:hypothetical protein
MTLGRLRMYTQRTRRPDQSFQPTSRWWTPVVTDADGARLPVDPRAGDAYVVVDEVLEGRVRLVLAPWPRLDREGRLHFADLGDRSGPYAVRTLQALVDRHRARHSQVLRPLRVGDAFLVRGDPRRLAGWEEVVDVTRGARAVAKVAMARAVTPSPQVPPRPRGRRRSAPSVAAGAAAGGQPERVVGSVALPNL